MLGCINSYPGLQNACGLQMKTPQTHNNQRSLLPFTPSPRDLIALGQASLLTFVMARIQEARAWDLSRWHKRAQNKEHSTMNMWQADFVNTLQGKSDYTHMCVVYWSAGNRTQSVSFLLQEKDRQTLDR